MVFGEGFSRLAEAFRGYWWAFRVWPSISWVLMGFSRFVEHFVGIGGHFVFGRAFRRYWWAFRVWQTG